MNLHCVIKYGKYGFLNELGEEVVPCVFQNVDSFREGKITVQDENGKWGFLDSVGKEIIPCKYDEADYFIQGRARVRIGNTYAIIDEHGNELTDFIFDWISVIHNYYSPIISFIVKVGEKWGAINKDGKIIISPEYEYIGENSSGYYEFKKDGKVGLMTSDEEIVVEAIYDRIGFSADSKLVVVRKNGKYGCLDLKGREVLPFEFDDIFTGYKGGFIIVKQDKKLGLYNKDGQELAPCIFEEIEELFNMPQFMKVRLYRKGWGLYASDGTELLPCEYQEISNLTFVNGSSAGTACCPISIKKKGKYGTYDPYKRQKIEECFSDESLI